MNNPTGLINRIFLLLLVTLLLSCTNTAGLQGRMDQSGNIVIDAYALGNDISIAQLKGEYVNDLYRAKVVIRNKKKRTQTLQYQITWLSGADQSEHIGQTAWTPLTLYGKAEKSVSALATSPQVGAFMVNVRDLEANTTFKTNFFDIK